MGHGDTGHRDGTRGHGTWGQDGTQGRDTGGMQDTGMGHGDMGTGVGYGDGTRGRDSSPSCHHRVHPGRWHQDGDNQLCWWHQDGDIALGSSTRTGTAPNIPSKGAPAVTVTMVMMVMMVMKVTMVTVAAEPRGGQS